MSDKGYDQPLQDGIQGTITLRPPSSEDLKVFFFCFKLLYSIHFIKSRGVSLRWTYVSNK